MIVSSVMNLFLCTFMVFAEIKILKHGIPKNNSHPNLEAHAMTIGEFSLSCLSLQYFGGVRIGKNVAEKSPALSIQSGESRKLCHHQWKETVSIPNKMIGRLRILARAKT